MPSCFAWILKSNFRYRLAFSRIGQPNISSVLSGGPIHLEDDSDFARKVP
jgi:hypothetical protein